LHWQSAAAQMWPAWRALCRWEETSAAELGPPFGDLLVLLWAVHRFSASDAGVILVDCMLDAVADGPACDPLLADLAECAFALGAGWAEARATGAAAGSY
jgi:hypothetical protein